MVITIPANLKHWHGTKKDSWFSPIFEKVPGENTSNEWCEPVSDEGYEWIYVKFLDTFFRTILFDRI